MPYNQTQPPNSKGQIWGSQSTQHPPRAVDLHVVLGAGADGDPGLQHKEHVETHLHVLFRGNLQKEAESVTCLLEYRKFGVHSQCHTGFRPLAAFSVLGTSS